MILNPQARVGGVLRIACARELMRRDVYDFSKMKLTALLQSSRKLLLGIQLHSKWKTQKSRLLVGSANVYWS